MAITDTSGNPYALYTMEAFGNVLEKGTSTGYSSEHQTDPQPYHLTTKEYESDVSLYYFNARWYDPGLGRFASRDPRPQELRLREGSAWLRALLRILLTDPIYSDWTNGYTYSHNCPTGHVDISGGCSTGGVAKATELGAILGAQCATGIKAKPPYCKRYHEPDRPCSVKGCGYRVGYERCDTCCSELVEEYGIMKKAARQVIADACETVCLKALGRESDDEPLM
jgi:RHS repeat-associated protein